MEGQIARLRGLLRLVDPIFMLKRDTRHEPSLGATDPRLVSFLRMPQRSGPFMGCVRPFAAFAPFAALFSRRAQCVRALGLCKATLVWGLNCGISSQVAPQLLSASSCLSLPSSHNAGMSIKQVHQHRAENHSQSDPCRGGPEGGRRACGTQTHAQA